MICAESARVLAAVRLSLSEESSSSSSPLPGLPSELKQHLAACAACAAVAAAIDPTLVFAPLAASVSSDAPARGARRSVEGDARVVSAAVLDEVRRRARVSPSPAAARRGTDLRRYLQAAALVALAAGLAGLVRWERGRGPLASAPTPPAPLSAAEPAPAPSLPAQPLLEGVRDPNVRVYEFAAASAKEPAVVFVANPNADL